MGARMDEEVPAHVPAPAPAEVSPAELTIYQKKFEPSPTELGLEIFVLPPRVTPKRHQAMTIVATLLDKLPNLAGLCRTGEVFSLAKLTLPSITLAADKQFKSMSVSAERWMPMEEVRPADLPAYLAAQKRAGATIVGLEQTSDSVRLGSFEFPERTVLVLGNEKDGMPAELFAFIDVCVEIPQLGLIRSLNVHTAASICVWEYTKQHALAIA